MSFLETSHTMTAINKVKADIKKVMTIISIVGFIIFAGYYSYLIINNYKKLLYLMIYIVLFITVFVTFITEIVLRDKKDQNRKEKRINYERKRIIKLIAKILKYLAKSITIIISIISMLNKEYVTLTSLFTIFSSLLLMIQIVLEGLVYYACKYIDYLKLALELDRDKGKVTKLLFRKEIKVANKEKKVYELEGDSYYTKQEQKIRYNLISDAKKYKEEREEDLNNRIKNSKVKIKELTKKRLTEKQIIKIDEKYATILAKSKDVLNNSKSLEKLLIKIEGLIDKLPKNVEALKYIPRFVSLINNYVTREYTDISMEFILSTIAIIIYIASPIDVIPDFIPGVGYLDESYLIGKCIEKFEDELKKFLVWRDSNNY